MLWYRRLSLIYTNFLWFSRTKKVMVISPLKAIWGRMFGFTNFGMRESLGDYPNAIPSLLCSHEVYNYWEAWRISNNQIQVKEIGEFIFFGYFSLNTDFFHRRIRKITSNIMSLQISEDKISLSRIYTVLKYINYNKL